MATQDDQLPVNPLNSTSMHVRHTLTKHHADACPPCQKLAKIERNIPGYNEERKALLPIWNEHHDPFANIPVELASSILIHCQLGPEDVNNPFAYYDEIPHNTTILSLCHVCHNWRNIAFNTPELWAIVARAVDESNCETSVAMIAHWLSRSGGLPLHLQLLILEGRKPRNVIPNSRKIIALVAQHAERWQVADLFIPSSLLHWTSTELSHHSLASLQHLKIEFEPRGDDKLHLKASPLKLTWRDGDLNRLPSPMDRSTLSLNRLSMDWGSLTHFWKEESLSPEEGMALFRNAPHLTFCHVQKIEPDYPDVPPGPPIVHERLTTLHVYHPNSWELFTLPSLETLSIGDDFSNFISPERLRALILRSGCAVKKLQIVLNDPEMMEEMVGILKLTPDLESLHVVYGSDDFFLGLDEAASPMDKDCDYFTFLSKLKTLALEYYDDLDYSFIVPFINFMKDRSLCCVDLRLRSDNSDLSRCNTDSRRHAFLSLMHAVEGIEFVYTDGDGDLIERYRRC